MRSDLTDITVVLDRSGSMSSIKDDAEGGLNTFIKEQAKQPGSALFTLVQFDTEYEFVHRAVPISEVPHCTLVPRGATALLDAVGRAIIETGDRLKNINENDRPGLVIIVILTDGLENQSREFTKDKVKEMIKQQSEVYKWQFVYLGANQDAFAEAGGIGIAASSSANYVQAGAAFTATSGNVTRMRTARATGQHVNSSYTDEERKKMNKKK
jgi:hypothetical protein